MIGRVLRTDDDMPLGNVTVRLGLKAIRTNSQGYFMLVDVPAGHQVLLFDGRSADIGQIHYPIALVARELDPGSPNVLPFTDYFPILDTSHAVKIDPLRETVLTTPLIPGLEVRIPRGTSITSIDGTPVTEISATLVPFNKPLYPMNLVPDFGNHVTIQPGGSVCSKPLVVIYNNPSHFPAGTRVELWKNAALDHGGWFNYGFGTVSKDGRQIIPDKNPGIQTIGCGVAPQPPPTPGGTCPTGCQGPDCGDVASPSPVTPSTGVVWEKQTDLVIPGLMPIVFQRNYRNQDNNSYEFGIGTTHSYDYRLSGGANGVSGSYVDFAMPGDTRYRFSYQTNFPYNTYVCTNDYHFAGAKIFQVNSNVLPQQDGYNYYVQLKDGTIYSFDGHGYLWLIRDARGNALTLNRHYDFTVKPVVDDLVQITQPSGRSISFSYNVPGNGKLISQATDSAGRSVGYSYDTSGRLIAITNVIGGVTTFAYDSNNNATNMTLPNGVVWMQNMFDSSNRITNQIVANGGSYSFSYTTNAASGAISKTVVTTPQGSASTTSYTNTFFDITGQLAAQFATNTVDALGNTNVYVRGSHNEILMSIDSLGRTNGFVYDANMNVLAITNAQAKVTQFTYEPNFNRLTSVIDPLGHTNSFGYDAYGNLTSITNALGKLTAIINNQFGQPVSVTDPLSNTYTFTYNATFDLVSVMDPLSNTVTRTVDALGRPIGLTDAFGRTIKITYSDLMGGCPSCGGGAADLPASITDPISGITSFGYDAVGNLTNVTDALSHTVSYAYDGLNQLTNRTDQLSKAEVYRYDKDGNVTNFVDRRGVSITFKYDMLDRRTGVVYAVGDSVQCIYDKVSRVTNVVDSIAGTINLTYDSLDRVTQENNNNGTVGYAYNDSGLRTNMTVSGQSGVAYFYDAANRLTNVVQGTITASLAYDDLGRRTNLTLPNGIKVVYRYDIGSRLTNITYLAAVTNAIIYAYDQAGNRVSQSSAPATYNLPSTISTSAYNSANQQLTFGSYSILYDADGNVTNIVSGTATNQLVWSARNQLTNMLGAVTATFAYDGLGRRVARTVSAVQEKYLYDGLDIIQQLNSSGSIAANYFRGLAIDEPWQRSDIGAATTNRIYLADALGSIVALTDSSGNISNTYSYEPFGNTTTTGAANKNSYAFTGRENDGTGLYFYRARYFDPALGRFVSEDPLDLARGASGFAYVNNNPVWLIDPEGLRAVTVGGYYGWGGAITCGWNPDGQFFLTLRVGWGLGASVSYDPTQTSPGYSTMPCGGQATLNGGLQGNVNFLRVFNLSRGYGGGLHLGPGDINTAFLPTVTPFSGPTHGGPSVSLPPSSGWGLGAGVSAGAQVTLY